MTIPLVISFRFFFYIFMCRSRIGCNLTFYEMLTMKAIYLHLQCHYEFELS